MANEPKESPETPHDDPATSERSRDDRHSSAARDLADGLDLMLRAARKAARHVDPQNIEALGRRALDNLDALKRRRVEDLRQEARRKLDPRRIEEIAEDAGKELWKVVERVTGRPFPEFMRQEVFLPLGMTNTWVRANPGQIIHNRSIGYVPGEFGFREVRDLHAAPGAGGMYTTPGDVAKWMHNFKTGQLGGPEVIRQITTSFVLNNGKLVHDGDVASLQGLAQATSFGDSDLERAILALLGEDE